MCSSDLEELGADAVNKLLGALPALGRTLLNFLTVFIQPAQETDPNPLAPRKPGQGVGQYLLVGVAEVGFGVRIVDRRGDVEGLQASLPSTGRDTNRCLGGAFNERPKPEA